MFSSWRKETPFLSHVYENMQFYADSKDGELASMWDEDLDVIIQRVFLPEEDDDEI